MLNYFNLNYQSDKAFHKITDKKNLNLVFPNLSSSQKNKTQAEISRIKTRGKKTAKIKDTTLEVFKKSKQVSKLSIVEQIFMFLGILIGILGSSFLDQAQSGEIIIFSEIISNLSLANLIISSFLAIMIMPYVYEKVGINAFTKTPFLIQFAIFVQNGVFWQVAVGAIGKAI